MEVNNSNHFWDWISNSYLPNCIVYSTTKAETIIGKNGVTPAEFLRPFGNFTGNTISFSFSDKFSINIKNFKLDFFDSTKFTKLNFSQMNEILENVFTSNQPYISKGVDVSTSNI